MSDYVPVLGKVIEGTGVWAASRDAIHVAVVPVTANEDLEPGQHVGRVTTTQGCVEVNGHPVGVVDPFLKATVKAGQMFWLLLYPNTVTGMRHQWSHPEFPEEATRPSHPDGPWNSPSAKWLQDFADENDLSYQRMMDAAANYLKSGECLSDGSRWSSSDLPDEFWDHYQVVTGVVVRNRGSFFSCSC